MRFDAFMAAGADSLGSTHTHPKLPATASPLRLGRFAWLEREAFPISVAALYAFALLLLMPAELVQDGWATLVAGREIAQHGLPHRETLTVMAHGARWIDQQWLGQLAFYELFRVGGYRLILLTNVILSTGAFGLALVAARRRGASPLSVAIVSCAVFFVAPWGWQLRAQSFAPLLFVGVLWLLIADSRSPSRRVFIVLPLLALWANLHGSVVLAALLTALYGVSRVIDRRRREVLKGTALIALAPLAVLCSPYGLSLVHYYRHLLINPAFGKLVVEWMAPAPGPITAVFYALAFATVWSVARWGRRLTAFERLALLVTLASALSATRNIVWFGLAVLVVLPLCVDEVRARASGGARPAVRAAAAFAALAAALGIGVSTMSRPASWYTKHWSDRAAASIAAESSDQSVRVFASDRYADWLLWRFPRLSGRVAFDIRFELNSSRQIWQLYDFFAQRDPHWRRAADGYRVLVLDRARHERLRKSLVAEGSVRQVYADKNLAVLTRTE